MNPRPKLCVFVAMLLTSCALGCGQAGQSGNPHDAGLGAASQGITASLSGGPAHVHSHEGWWCDEHAVPEEICGQCNSKLAAEFQKKGDWCKDHDRPESQCFICHPELEAKFAAKYQAKFGEKPPKSEQSDEVSHAHHSNGS